MRFTVERKALVKMLQCVGKKAPSQKRREKQVRLSACAARVFVEANETTAGTEALVLEDGTCFLSQDIFLKVLKTYKTKPNVTVEADGRTLRFFSSTLPVTDYSHAVTPPGKFQVFPVTDLSVLRPDAAPAPPVLKSPPPPEPEPPPTHRHRPGTFPITQPEMASMQEMARLTRRLCSLPRIPPQEIVGLARAIHALDRLPLTTKLVDVEFSLHDYGDTKESYPIVLQVSATSLSLGFILTEKSTQTNYSVTSTGNRDLEAGPDGIADWLYAFRSLLDSNSKGLRLSVDDRSAPGLLSAPSKS
ncbi:MAG TPA: hypothetical protein PKK20_07705 [Verrucomicrobiota bacterium]|jgi:hypothetical protein|nr:hypothetical protein [Verrucomicrobiota bacterium]HOH40539.1 hypothetical protein [Verrucomicrobiota bacterium]